MSALATRLERLEQILAAKIDPLPVRHVIVDIGDELSMEAEGELPICEIIVAPPERPEDEPLPLMAASPSIDHASRERHASNPTTGGSAITIGLA